MGTHLEIDDRVIKKINQFVLREAEMIDNRQFNDWLELMTEDLVYRVPLRVTKPTGSDEFFHDMAHMDDNRTRMEQRIRRLESEFAWAESPPSRTRHFVTNVRIEQTEKENEFLVKSNLLLYRNRGDSADFDLLSGERHDIVREEGGELKLAQRIVYLDQTTLATHNLSIFF